MPRKELSIEERNIIINNHKMGKSYSQIAVIIGKSKSTMQKIINRFKNEKRIENKPRSGRPLKLNATEERKIVALIKNDPIISASKIAAELKESLDKSVSADTVRRSIKRAGYNAQQCAARKKPFINETNRKK